MYKISQRRKVILNSLLGSIRKANSHKIIKIVISLASWSVRVSTIILIVWHFKGTC